MKLQYITLISFGYFERDFLKIIAETVEHEFHFPVNFKEGHIDLTEFYDTGRRQYNGNNLLKVIDLKFATASAKTLGLFSVDIFIPILTYIFGQAFLDGQAGIASLNRLSNERYGLKKDDAILIDRFKKEVIHELGHMFGLIHCHNQTCVMRSSTYVEDIDQKSHALCNACRSELINQLKK